MITSKKLLSKVPEITLYFWIIKVLCTTTGETFSDFLNVNMNFGLVGTSIVMGIALLIALFFQFRASKYTPSIYWTTVVLVSVFGTLVTDNLTDKMHVPLEYSTIFFSGVLALTFAFWYKSEQNLSIHSIFTKRREMFYWLAILFTFALGTASGDLMAEGLALGYSLTGIIICSIIVIISIAWKMGMNSILSFWLIYIMTRPLGAAFGDYLSQPIKYGGIGLGATNTSIIFLLAILALIVFLTLTKKDMVKNTTDNESESKELGGLRHTIIALLILSLVSGVGYFWRQSVLASPIVNPSTSIIGTSVLGDLSIFSTITQDTLNFVNAGDIPSAITRIKDFEHEWDIGQARMKPMNPTKWTEIDGAIDIVLRDLRSTSPDTASCKSSLEALSNILKLSMGSANNTLKISTPMSTVATPLGSTGSGKITTKTASVLGDLSVFSTITNDTLKLVNTGNIPGGVVRIKDFEHEWDIGQARMKPMNPTKWTEIDGAIDTVLRDLRATNPDPTSCKKSLEALLTVLH